MRPMKSILVVILVVGFAVFASAQAGAPAAAINPPLREAPSLTIIRAKSITLKGSPMVGMTSFEMQGPRIIEAEEAEISMDTDEAFLRGTVRMRSAVDEIVARR